MTVWCDVCNGGGRVVWGRDPERPGVQIPRASTEDEEDDMDVQKCICPACDGSGIEP